MKPIRGTTLDGLNSINVQYDDDTNMSFSIENKEIIEHNHIEQIRMNVKRYKIRKIEKYEDNIKNERNNIIGYNVISSCFLALLVLSLLLNSTPIVNIVASASALMLSAASTIAMFKTIKKKTNLEIDLDKLKQDLGNELNNENEKSRRSK